MSKNKEIKHKIITIFNRKGGVGKTTIAINLARHLQFCLYEIEKDYLSYVIPKYESLSFEKSCCDGCTKNTIIDANSTDPVKLKNVLIHSSTILIPTCYDMKDVVKTIASIKFAHKCNKNAKILVVFNLLDPVHLESEKGHTQAALNFINEKVGKIKFDVAYIRRNRAWFKNNSRFLGDKTDIDLNTEWFKQPKLFNFYQNASLYVKVNPKSENDAAQKPYLAIEDNPEISSYFSSNHILEIMYQYLFYYNPIYEARSKILNKEIKEIQSNYKSIISQLDGGPLEKKRLKKEYETACKKEIREKKSHNSTVFLFDDKEIATLTKDFQKVEGFQMITLNNMLFDTLQAIYPKESSDLNIHYHKIFPEECDKKHKKDILDAKLSDTDIKIYSKINKNGLNEKQRKMQIAILLREEFLYKILTKFINFKELHNHRKVIKDFRNLLISLGEYNAKH